MIANYLRGRSIAPLLSLAVAGLVVAGCPTTDGPVDEAFVSLQTGSGVTTLVADGRASLQVSARAFASDGSRDNATMTVSATGGTITSTTGTVDAEGRRVVGEATDGILTFTFTCTALVAETVTLGADNGNGQASLSITCIQPTGGLQVTVNTNDCIVGLNADGQSACEVTARAEIRLGGPAEPRPGARFTATVLSTTNVKKDGTPAGDEEGNKNVLSLDGSGGVPSLANLTADDNGEVRFMVRSPVLALEQSINLELIAEDDALGVFPSATASVVVREFDNQSSLVIQAAQTQVVGGQPVTLTLVGRGPNGGNADIGLNLNHVATITVNDPQASLTSGPDTGTTVSADFVAGNALVTLNTPTLGINDPPRELVISATFQPLPELNALTATRVITVNAEGALLVNVDVTYGADDDGNPTTAILSDDNTSAVVDVELVKDGAPVNYPVRFQVRDADVERIGFDVRADNVYGALLVNEPPQQGGSPVFATPTNGVISATVSSQTNRVRGAAVVVVTVDDTDDGFLRTYEIILNVNRDPILQSVVYGGAAPEAIGTLGSAYPSSTVVSFKIFDDLNQPMSNVPVTFALPDSADPAASVVGADLSTSDGSVSTVLSAGTQVGPLAVVATASFGGVTIEVQSSPIPVSGGLPSFANSYVICDPATVIQEYAFNATCQLVLADRFTNVTPDLPVQFRAEGGNITPIVTGTDSATFATGSPGRSSPDARVWSYGIDLPFPFDLGTSIGSVLDVNACFDNTSATTCNLHALCSEGDNPLYCPLPDDPVTQTGCWELIPKLGLALMEAEVADCTSLPSGADMIVDCGASGSVTVPNGATRIGNGQPLVNFATYYNTPAITTAVDALRNEEVRCGFPVSCLTGQQAGFAWTDSDDCKVAMGCMDFTGATSCVHDGLITIMASVRGEESFADENGNGVFDFTDTNGNGSHDPGEPSESFTDLPEPFLDKNDNCAFDSFNGHPRFEPVQEVQHSDQFSDEDASGSFGFGPTRQTSNGAWDVDKQIMLTSHLLGLVSGPILRSGEYCDKYDAALGVGGYTCSNGLASTCVEYFDGYGLANCRPLRLVDPSLIAQTAIRDNAYANDVSETPFDYIWADANGNIHNEGFGQTSSLTTDGPLIAAGSTSINLRDYTRGIAETGNGVLNVRRPWCDDYPNLGPGLAPAAVAADCSGATEQSIFSKIVVSHSNGTVAELGINVICPVCGDGYLAGDEACDPAIPVGQVGYDPGCNSDCAIE